MNSKPHCLRLKVNGASVRLSIAALAKSVIAAVCLALMSGVTLQATPEVHPDVQEALDYQLPANTCEEPRLRGQNWSNETPDGVTTADYDLDYYTIERHERKVKRWEKCVKKYKDGLRKDFKRLKSVASHDPTPEQVKTVIGHLSLINNVLQTRDGLPPETTP